MTAAESVPEGTGREDIKRRPIVPPSCGGENLRGTVTRPQGSGGTARAITALRAPLYLVACTSGTPCAAAAVLSGRLITWWH